MPVFQCSYEGKMASRRWMMHDCCYHAAAARCDLKCKKEDGRLIGFRLVRLCRLSAVGNNKKHSSLVIKLMCSSFVLFWEVEFSLDVTLVTRLSLYQMCRIDAHFDNALTKERLKAKHILKTLSIRFVKCSFEAEKKTQFVQCFFHHWTFSCSHWNHLQVSTDHILRRLCPLLIPLLW